jgi:hypothetical protein
MMTNSMTPEQLQTAALERRERLLKFHVAYLAEIREVAGAWLDSAEEMHEVEFSPVACEALAETAPDDSYLRGYWLGRAQSLHRIAALTERSVDC